MFLVTGLFWNTSIKFKHCSGRTVIQKQRILPWWNYPKSSDFNNCFPHEINIDHSTQPYMLFDSRNCSMKVLNIILNVLTLVHSHAHRVTHIAEPGPCTPGGKMVSERLLTSFHVDFFMSIILIRSQVIVCLREEGNKRTYRKSWSGFCCGKLMIPWQ